MRLLLITQLQLIVLSSLFSQTSPGVEHRCAVFPKIAARSEAAVGSPNLAGLLIHQSANQGPPFTFPKFDEYGDLSLAKERERLDFFAMELRSVSGESGYIIEYRRKGRRQKRLTRAKRAKDYLVKSKKIDAERLVIVDGGLQKQFKIELRLGPTRPN